jgi:hypothetical protein
LRKMQRYAAYLGSLPCCNKDIDCRPCLREQAG